MGKNAIVFVFATPISHTVHEAFFFFDEHDKWTLLEHEYKETVKAYKNKYGTPFETVQNFSSPYERTNGLKMMALRDGKCHYYTSWKTENGFINVSITDAGSAGEYSGNVSVFYSDKENGILFEIEKQRLINDDI